MELRAHRRDPDTRRAEDLTRDSVAGSGSGDEARGTPIAGIPEKGRKGVPGGSVENGECVLPVRDGNEPEEFSGAEDLMQGRDKTEDRARSVLTYYYIT